MEMKEEQLMGRLRAADAAAGPPPDLPGDLMRLAERRLRRRRLRRRVGGGLGLAALAVAAAWHGLAPRRPGGVAGGIEAPDRALRVEVARLHARAEALCSEARSHSAVAEGLLAAERLRGRQVWGPEGRLAGQASVIRDQVDRAAYLTVRRAEMLLEEVGDPPAAAAAYQQVIDTFPGTYWAQLARRRRAALRDKTGETL